MGIAPLYVPSEEWKAQRKIEENERRVRWLRAVADDIEEDVVGAGSFFCQCLNGEADMTAEMFKAILSSLIKKNEMMTNDFISYFVPINNSEQLEIAQIVFDSIPTLFEGDTCFSFPPFFLMMELGLDEGLENSLSADKAVLTALSFSDHLVGDESCINSLGEIAFKYAGKDENAQKFERGLLCETFAVSVQSPWSERHTLIVEDPESKGSVQVYAGCFFWNC